MRAPSAGALLEVLQKFGRAQARRPKGEGWYTLEELAQQAQTTKPTLKYKMEQAKKRGVVFEQATGTTVDEDGQAKRSTFYRLKRKPE